MVNVKPSEDFEKILSKLDKSVRIKINKLKLLPTTKSLGSQSHSVISIIYLINFLLREVARRKTTRIWKRLSSKQLFDY